jgi:hypothetical protein
VPAPGSGFCISCGAWLEATHRYCWSCGAARWIPPPEEPAAPAEGAPRAEPERAPPTPGTTVFDRPPAARPAAPADPGLGLLPWFYAAGAIFFLVEATKGLASVLSPAGRAQVLGELTRDGLGTSIGEGGLIAYWLVFIVACLVAAALHGAAFHGLRRLRRWGWISAVVVASIWSLLIVGIPVLVRLVNRNVRQAFGVD